MSQKQDNNQEAGFLFGKKNYILVVLGALLMIAGYFLMMGGANPEPGVFNAEEKYGFVRITLAPILILGGLLIEAVAIFTKRA